MGSLRVAAILCAARVEELDTDAFAVDCRRQLTMCERWSAQQGTHVAVEWLLSTTPPHLWRLWEDVENGQVDVIVAANERMYRRCLGDLDAFTARCHAAGVSVVTSGFDEPLEYDHAMRRTVMEQLSPKLSPG